MYVYYNQSFINLCNNFSIINNFFFRLITFRQQAHIPTKTFLIRNYNIRILYSLHIVPVLFYELNEKQQNIVRYKEIIIVSECGFLRKKKIKLNKPLLRRADHKS